MNIALNTQFLSDDSLRMLDQTSVLTKKDFNQLFLFIESLMGIEKKVFLGLFKEENNKLHSMYEKKINEIQSKLFEEQQRNQQDEDQKRKEAAKRFSDEWSFSKVELILKQFNPFLCGVLIKNNVYYKELTLKDSIPYLFKDFGDASYESILPFVFLEIKNISFNKPYQTYIDYAGVTERFCLCTGIESRDQIIADVTDRIEGIKKMHLNQGFTCTYDRLTKGVTP